MIRSVVLATARSGSNLLLSLLNSHPGFYFHGEIFHPTQVNTLRTARAIRETTGMEPTALRDRNPVKFVATVFASTPAKVRTAGFKLFLGHNRKVIRHVVRDEEIRLVLLDRENRLGSFSSRLLTGETRVWWVKEGGEAATATSHKAVFDAAQFTAHREQLDRAYARIGELLEGRPHTFRLDYRDLDDEAKLADLARFLGAERPAKMTPGIVRQHAPNLLERFSNPAEVATHLERIGRSSWLDEGG